MGGAARSTNGGIIFFNNPADFSVILNTPNFSIEGRFGERRGRVDLHLTLYAHNNCILLFKMKLLKC